MENYISDVPYDAGKFTVPDYIIFSLLLLVSVAVGLYSAFGKDNSTTKEFLVGGNAMPVIPVALSLIGGVVSAISILGKIY